MSRYQDITDARVEESKQREMVDRLSDLHKGKFGFMEDSYHNNGVEVPPHLYKSFRILLLDYYEEKLAHAEQKLLDAAHDFGKNEGDS